MLEEEATNESPLAQLPMAIDATPWYLKGEQKGGNKIHTHTIYKTNSYVATSLVNTNGLPENSLGGVVPGT